MANGFYTFVGDGSESFERDESLSSLSIDTIRYPARIAVYDDPTITPRVVTIQPKPVRDYLEEITATVNQLSHEQGGTIPFMIIREIVENYIHAYFIAPTISILDGGNTLRFADQGPGIIEKNKALEYGTTSATEEMKQYIRGVGSGLPLAQQYMLDKGGSLSIQDNMSHGTVVTISTRPEEDVSMPISPIPKQREMVEQETQAQLQQQLQQMQAVQETQHLQYQAAALPLSKRSHQILAYLSSHAEVGPKDLVETYKGSQPTWSRELKRMETQGLLVKQGQKRRLTPKGRAHIAAVE